MIKSKKIYAIIPARGGSKGIPKKNIIDFDGFPLIYHSINFAKSSKFVDEVIVSTDSHEIKEIAEKYHACVLDRPENISTDDSSIVPIVTDEIGASTTFFSSSYV